MRAPRSNNRLRSYLTQLKHNQFEDIRRILNSMPSISLSINNLSLLQKYLPHDVSTELVVRQYLSWSLLPTIRHAIACLFTKTPHPSFPVPQPWMQYLSQYSPVNKTFYRFHWSFYLISRLFLNTIKSYRYLLRIFIRRPGLTHSASSSFFLGLTHANLPHHSYKQATTKTLFSVVLSSLPYLADTFITVESHLYKPIYAEDLRFSDPPYLLVSGFLAKLHLLVYANYLYVRSFFGLLFGQYTLALLHHELLLAKAVDLLNPAFLASHYFFHYSADIYRPLWTYVAESKGSHIYNYFYSSYEEPTHLSGRQVSRTFPSSIAISTWSNFLVWDNIQASLISSSLRYRQASFRVCGPVPFVCSNSSISRPLQPSISLFDIPFYHPDKHFFYGSQLEYYLLNPLLYKNFFQDLAELSSEYGLRILYKPKRAFDGKHLKSSYLNALNRFVSHSTVQLVDSSMSPSDLISTTTMSVSMCFTSTALYAQSMQLPTCYYDPTGMILFSDPASHGIPVCNSRTSLEAWILSLI